MGFVHIKVGISSIKSDRFSYYTALIDTGATKPVLPSKIAEELGIEKGVQRSVMTGNGPVTMYESSAYFEIEGMKTVSPIWISDFMDKILIGVIALESVGLAVDPKKGTLKKEDFLLYKMVLNQGP